MDLRQKASPSQIEHERYYKTFIATTAGQEVLADLLQWAPHVPAATTWSAGEWAVADTAVRQMIDHIVSRCVGLDVTRRVDGIVHAAKRFEEQKQERRPEIDDLEA
jgi:hypothetical protein